METLPRLEVGPTVPARTRSDWPRSRKNPRRKASPHLPPPSGGPMAVSVVVFHLRPPPLCFAAPHAVLGLGNPSPCSSSRLFDRMPERSRPPLRTITTKTLRLDDSWRQGRKVVCRAHLAEDAPFAIAIGACILNSLVFPIRSGPEDGTEGSDGGGIDSTDMRFAVMGILSFIPYFNWMSWIFAWLDTSRQRYLVYSILYLAPYLRTNLSLSPNDSWLPIASILACIVHIQLEASIRSGDINGIPMLGETLKHLSPVKRKDAGGPRRRKDTHEEESRKNLGEGDVWRNPVDDLRHVNETKDLNEEERN